MSEVKRALMKFTARYYTAIGGRDYNEDSVHVSDDGSNLVAVVADGLGGHGGGAIASKTACEFLGVYPAHDISKDEIFKHFNKANAEILNRQTSKCKMKSTAVMLVCNTTVTAVAHIGDSRCYTFHDGKIASCTVDHSVSQLAVASGEISTHQIRFHEDKNKLFRALGTGEKIKPEIVVHEKPANPGDAFLLCSDGFWEYVYEEETEKTLALSASPDEWINRMCEILSSRAPEGNDNISVVAVFCEEG